MTLFAELLHRSADAREVLRTCTGSSWQVEGREQAGCLPWCFSSLQPLPGATERCLPCPALVNTSCPPALPALPPLLPPSYHSAFPPPPLLRLSLPNLFSSSLSFLSSCPQCPSDIPRSFHIVLSHSPPGCLPFPSSPVGVAVISLSFSFPLCPALFSFYHAYYFFLSFLLSALQIFFDIPILRKILSTSALICLNI